MIAVTLIEIPSWGNVTLIEAMWLISGLVVLTVSSAYLRPLSLDWMAAAASRRDVLRVVAAGNLRREVLRLAQGLAIAGIGIYVATQPTAVPGPAVTTVTGLVLTGALIAIALLVAGGSISDWHARGEVRGYIKHDAPTENAILLVDSAGRITYSNSVADKVFGRRLVGLVVEDLVPERLRIAHREHRAHYATNPTPRPMGIDLGTVGLRLDGSEFPIYATLSPFTDEAGESFTLMTVKLG